MPQKCCCRRRHRQCCHPFILCQLFGVTVSLSVPPQCERAFALTPSPPWLRGEKRAEPGLRNPSHETGKNNNINNNNNGRIHIVNCSSQFISGCPMFLRWLAQQGAFG